MKDLLTDHPSQPVRAAAANLLEALASWHRSTDLDHLVIVRDAAGCAVRVRNGQRIADDVSDAQVLHGVPVQP